MNSPISTKQFELIGPGGRPIAAQAVFPVSQPLSLPVFIFVHGFKGFKDWGGWLQMASQAAAGNFIFLSFNFSHSGIGKGEADYFNDLQGFAENTISLELEDLKIVVDFLWHTPPDYLHIDPKRIYLAGHSRGGGTAIIYAHEDERIKGLATWAAVNDFGFQWGDEVKLKWRKQGFIQTLNARTGQTMKQNIALLNDYEANKDRFDILRAASLLRIPHLILHGTEDETVPFSHALEIKRARKDATLDLIPNATHTFGMRHPMPEGELPFDARLVITKTLNFFS